MRSRFFIVVVGLGLGRKWPGFLFAQFKSNAYICHLPLCLVLLFDSGVRKGAGFFIENICKIIVQIFGGFKKNHYF